MKIYLVNGNYTVEANNLADAVNMVNEIFKKQGKQIIRITSIVEVAL